MTPFSRQLDIVGQKMAELQAGEVQEEAAAQELCIMMQTFFAVEASIQSLARSVLPISTRALVEDWLAEFANRFTGDFEDGAISELDPPPPSPSPLPHFC